MSDKKSNNSSWFFSALTLLFIGLKLTNYITWSWWWVLAPVWMPVSAVITGFVLYLLIDWVYRSGKTDNQKITEEIGNQYKKDLKDGFKPYQFESKFQRALRQAMEKSNARDN